MPETDHIPAEQPGIILARGVCRMLAQRGFASLTEFTTRDHLRMEHQGLRCKVKEHIRLYLRHAESHKIRVANIAHRVIHSLRQPQLIKEGRGRVWGKGQPRHDDGKHRANDGGNGKCVKRVCYMHPSAHACQQLNVTSTHTTNHVRW